jgi:hypothetical protein
MVKDKFTFDFVQLHHLAIQFGRDVRFPVFRDLCKLLRDVYFFHCAPSEGFWCSAADSLCVGLLSGGEGRKEKAADI